MSILDPSVRSDRREIATASVAFAYLMATYRGAGDQASQLLALFQGMFVDNRGLFENGDIVLRLEEQVGPMRSTGILDETTWTAIGVALVEDLPELLGIFSSGGPHTYTEADVAEWVQDSGILAVADANQSLDSLWLVDRYVRPAVVTDVAQTGARAAAVVQSYIETGHGVPYNEGPGVPRGHAKPLPPLVTSPGGGGFLNAYDVDLPAAPSSPQQTQSTSSGGWLWLLAGVAALGAGAYYVRSRK